MTFFFFSSRRRHTRLQGDWSSDVCSSDLSISPSVRLEERIAPPLILPGSCSAAVYFSRLSRIAYSSDGSSVSGTCSGGGAVCSEGEGVYAEADTLSSKRYGQRVP